MTTFTKYLTLVSVFALLFARPCISGDTFNPFTGSPDQCVTIKEIDGSPENVSCGDLKVSNGALTDNGDGTFTLTTGVGGGGDVSGPGSATDNAAVRFDGTGGKTIQNSGVVIDDSDNMIGVTSLNIDGASGNTLIVNTSALVVNATSNNVGIGTTATTQKLEVSGNVKATTFIGALTGNVTGTSTNIADANYGDVTISSGAWAVANDSHSHTSTTLPATTSYLGTSIETGEITDSTIVTADINWDAFVVDDGSINWAVQVPLAETDPVWSAWDGSTGINWEAAIGGINWTLIDTVKLNGINWDYYAAGGTSVWGENDSTAYYTDGNVGVGVSVATQALHVSGGVRLASLNCSGNANGGALTTDANGVVSCSDDDSGAGSGVNNGVINAFAYYPAAGTTVDDQTALYLAGGNVGIGISTASQKLQVSGTVLATAFSGPLTGNVTGDLTGNASTATTASTANAGDSATAFFSAGTIEHERGGLEADVSAYNGFVKISGGSTSAVTANGGTDLTADLEEETHASEHAVSAADTVFPADPGADRFLVWDDDPGALIWTTESDPSALLTAGTDNVKDTHIDWGAGAGQVNMDDLSDGSTNVVMTLTQETNFEAAYTHSTDNSQAHSDYLINNGNDTTSGNITAAGFIGVGTSITGMTLGQFDDQTAWRLFYSNADGDVTELALGTDGQVLTSTGASTAPAFEDASGGTQEWTETGGILAPTTGTDDVAVDTNVFYVDVSANNVGVGTSVPSQKLQVSGTVLATAFSGPLTGNVTGTATNVADADYGDVTVSSGAWAVEDDSHAHVYSNIDATTSSNWASVVSDETGTGAWVFATGPTLAGNVGIGATGPNELSVVGEVAIGTTAYTNRASPTSGLLVEGNVGIGTTATVTSKLVVGGTSGIVSFTGVTSDPCSTAPVGSIFYNSTANVLCYCNGSNADIQVGVGSTTPCF